MSDRTPEQILVTHRRWDIESCMCGWSELGKSHAAHQVAALRDAGMLHDPQNIEWGTSDSDHGTEIGLDEETARWDASHGPGVVVLHRYVSPWLTDDGKVPE